MSFVRVIKKFGGILSRNQKFKIIQLAVFMVIGGLLELFSVSLAVPFMNAAMDPQGTMEQEYVIAACDMFGLQSADSFLIFTAVILALLYILKNAYLVFEYNLQYRFTYGNLLKVQKKLLDSFLNRPYEYYLGINSGEVIRVISTDAGEGFYMLVVLLEILTELVVSLMLITSMLIISPMITAAMGAVLAILLLGIMLVIKPVLYRVGAEHQRTAAGMYKWLLQAIQGIKEVKIMNKEPFFQEKFERYGSRHVMVTRRKNILTIVPKFIIEAASMSTMFLLIALLIYSGENLNEIVPILAAAAMAAIRLLPSVNRISSALGEIAYREPKLDKMIEYLNETKRHYDTAQMLTEQKHEAESFGFQRDLVFENVSYRYPGSQTPILKNVSLSVKKGESVGLVGTSGSGKTTTADILLGLLTPYEGRVLADGADIAGHRKEWNRLIGYIPQNIFMLDGSIRENVAFGIRQNEADDREIWTALKEASLDEFVRSLPEQLDTEIGERGVRLSGGQRQRIGIARALYTHPQILVFDEATSALDNETEADVMQSISRLLGKRTIVIIAHRLTTIEKCEHVLRVQDAEVLLER